MTYGGSKVRLLNCEYGARLSCPSLLRVDIQPIGRGITHAYAIETTSSRRLALILEDFNFPLIQQSYTRTLKGS